MKKVLLSSIFLLSSFNLLSCEAVKDTFGVPNRSPVIASFDFNPKSGITKNDVVVFTVVANDPEGKPLQYTWTSTKGTLTGNAGSTISWRPVKQDNTFDTGLSNVSLVVSDGIMTTTASVNIYVSQDGSVSIASVPTSPSPSISPTATPSPIISVSPSATPSPVATISPVPTISPSTIPVVSSSPCQCSSPASNSTTVIVRRDN